MKSVEDLYLGENMNCAESTLCYINESRSLGIDEKGLRLIAGFGGGMGCGKTCGVLAASIAALGALMVKEKAHDTPGFRALCADYALLFEREFGSTDCAGLKKNYSREGYRCADLVNANAELLDGFLKELQDKIK